MGKGVFKDAWGAARRRWRYRRSFSGWRDWSVSLYDTLLRYVDGMPLPGYGRVCSLRLTDESRPIFLRLGTSDGFVMEEIFVARVYAPVVSAGLTRVRQIVDLGANVGLSIRFWRKYFPEARIVGVEPDLGNFEACRRNVGDDDHVQLVQGPSLLSRAWSISIGRPKNVRSQSPTSR